MEFSTLDLPAPVMDGIRDAGFVTATPIQEAALPLALRGKDVAGQSQTGTGLGLRPKMRAQMMPTS